VICIVVWILVPDLAGSSGTASSLGPGV